MKRLKFFTLYLRVFGADFQKFPMIPALKAAVAHWQGDADWARVRPPLVELTAQQTAEMTTTLKAHGFDMPGLGKR